jgi:hypothetical protein
MADRPPPPPLDPTNPAPFLDWLDLLAADFDDDAGEAS